METPNRPKGCFITATDTGAGKTYIALSLMAALREKGLTVAGMKPVASGCEDTADGLRNDDALKLIDRASTVNPYPLVNPYAFAPPIAPHIAAGEAGVEIELDKILDCYRQLATAARFIVVEGIGGWRVPLNRDHSVSDLVKLLDLPVILVVGLRLGCINHALLTVEAIRADGLLLAGWVANRCDRNYAKEEETLSTLKERIAAPLLGRVPWAADLGHGAHYLADAVRAIGVLG